MEKSDFAEVMVSVTHEGRLIPLLGEYKPNIEEIAHTLAHRCMFGGKTQQFYSLAQHSVEVCRRVPEQYKFQALMMHAHKAYMGDCEEAVVAVINLLGNNAWEKFEAYHRGLLRRWYLLPPSVHQCVKDADRNMLQVEIVRLFDDKGVNAFMQKNLEPEYGRKLRVMGIDDSFNQFLTFFNKYSLGFT